MTCGQLVLALAVLGLLPLHAAGGNHRMILLTDLLAEQDDSQMMVRLLMYANEMDIEGLIAVSISEPGYPARAPSQPHRVGVHPEEIISRIEAYAKVRDQLLKHAPGWPTRRELMSKVACGPEGYGMAAVGDGKGTPGSRMIIAAVEKPDPRPIYICVTGSANTLAQAIWDYRKTHTPEQMKAFVAKIRVYDDFGQDDSGAWICHNFPEIVWIRSLDQVFGLMGPGPPHIPPGYSPTARDPYVWQPYPPTDEGQHLWMKEHVQNNHGPLGALYIDRIEANGAYRYLEGGNTSTWIGLVNKGLYDPEQITWGGWGGRFGRGQSRHGAAQAVLLVVPLDDLGGDVDAVGGPQHRALLAGNVEHDGQRIGLGVLVDNGHHALADFIDHLLLFLRHFVLQVFRVPLIFLAHCVDVAAELLARFGRHGVCALIELVLQAVHFGHAAFQVLGLGFELRADGVAGLLAVLGSEHGALHIDNSDFIRRLRRRGGGNKAQCHNGHSEMDALHNHVLQTPGIIQIVARHAFPPGP